MKEEINLIKTEVQIDNNGKATYDTFKEYLAKNEFILQGNKITSNKYLGYVVEIDIDTLEIIGYIKTENGETYNESLIDKVSKIKDTGYYDIQVYGKNKDNVREKVTYSINATVIKGDIILNGINEIDGSILKNGVYEFGDVERDVATQDEEAKNMVVLKVEGNITINQGITLTSCKSEQGYGGSKGLFIYCTGKFVNNGIVTMTQRGAKAKGQNVYLWENLDGSYEYIPSVGASGGEGIYLTQSYDKAQDGELGTMRKTGGGRRSNICFK